MGARQSFQTDLDRRPRSNSTVEAVDVAGGSGRRTLSHYRHHNQNDASSNASDFDEEAEELSAGFASLASLGLSSSTRLSQSISTPTSAAENGSVSVIGGTASSAPSPSHHSTYRLMNNISGSSANTSGSSGNGGGLRFCLRPNTATTRSTFLQALTGTSSISPNTSSSILQSSSSSNLGSNGGRRRGGGTSRNRYSVPVLHLIGRDIRCPICHKKVPSDDVEVHLVMCFTRPRIAYNEDVLEAEKGECAICLDEMDTGDTIARLPCLCIYHKTCIDEWFKRKNCCPEHPGEE